MLSECQSKDQSKFLDHEILGHAKGHSKNLEDMILLIIVSRKYLKKIFFKSILFWSKL